MRIRPLAASLLVAGVLALGADPAAARAQRPAGAGGAAASRAGALPPALSAIREEDLRRDLFALAGDAMRGRRAGTIDELRASAWVAEQARKAGLEPAGEDGSYFQFWPMRRVVTSKASRVEIGGRALRLGQDAHVVSPTNFTLTAPVVWLGSGDSAATQGMDLRGKVVALELSAPPQLPAPGMSLWGYRYTSAAVGRAARALGNRGVAGIILVSDTVAEREMSGFYGGTLEYGRYAIDTGTFAMPRTPAVVWVGRAWLDALRATPAPTVGFALDYDSYVFPSVNVVARVRGTDARLRDEYVLFSAHQDHDGVAPPVNGDSIYNGADDNASTSVALLAIGRAFARQPGRRSALFVWHGAEERGLLGSRWHALFPTVPREQIVAVLNGDMIGNGPDSSAGLLGVQPPHLNSSDLARMALEANDRLTKFAIDSTWDRATHPEGWYFRSDHAPYARFNIPSVYFSTLPHPLYHTPADEPQTIKIPKLARMTRWMYATGWAAANAAARPRLEPGFRLER